MAIELSGYIVFIFIVHPSIILMRMGLDIEKMDLFSLTFFLTIYWISIYLLFKFSFKALKSIYKKYFSSRKLTKYLHFSIPMDL